MTGPLAGKVAIVTGAATGIGRAIAARLGADGAAVVVNHKEPEQPAAAVVAGIESAGGRAVAALADVSTRTGLESLFATAEGEFGGVDVVVGNAAVAITRPLVELTEADIDLSLAVNVKGTLLACQLAARRLRPGGCVITLSSSTTGLMFPGYALYDATKGAVEQLTRVLSREFGPLGLRINAISPGATETETYRVGKSTEFLDRVAGLSAFDRLGRPEEIAAAAAFLAGPDAGWITGQVLRVNGGTV